MQRSSLIPAFTLVFGLIGLLGVLYWAEDGYPSALGWVFAYVGVALITGIAFWALTGSTGDLTLPQIGLRLGGGAAIGAGFMLLAHSLTPQTDRDRLIEIQVPDAGGNVYLVPKATQGCRVEQISHSGRFIALLDEGAKSAQFSVRYHGTDGRLRERKIGVQASRHGVILGDPVQQE